MIFNTIDNNYFPFMVFNEEPLLDFIIPITVIIELISIHGIYTFLHDGLFLIYLHEWITISFHLWFSVKNH